MGRFTQFLTTPTFRQSFSKLTADAQDAARAKFQVFRADPFDPSLRPRAIKFLSSRFRRPIYSVQILGNLRAVFYVEAEKVIAFDFENHAIYR